MQVFDLRNGDFDTSHEATALIEALRESPIVVFAGSAVSRWKPSNLIDGMNLTRSLWQSLFREFDCTPEEHNFIHSLVETFPFEHLFELCPNAEKAKQFLIEIYDCSASNSVHEAIASAFAEGKISHLITTNYDKCFEGALKKRHPDSFYQTVVDEAQASLINGNDSSKVYFKVHGTADRDSTSLIFRLRDEGILPKGKRQLLYSLLAERDCLFIGYSGLDFELCPFMSKVPVRSIVWLDLGDRPISFNASGLLALASGTLIKADMRDFIPWWLGIQWDDPPVASRTETQKLAGFFSANELWKWRISLLNNLGFPKLTRQALSDDAGRMEESERMLHEARILAYEGKYLSSANVFSLLSRRHAGNQQIRRSSDCWLDAADAFRGGGYYGKAWLCLFKGRYSCSNYDKAKYFLKKSLLIQNLVQLGGFFEIFGPITKFLKSWLARNLAECAKYALEDGSIHDFQQVGFIAERYDIKLERLLKEDYYVPFQALEGYKHLGYFHGEVMAFNDECSKSTFAALSADEKDELAKAFERYIGYCELTHQNAILWKLLANKKRFLTATSYAQFKQGELLNSLFAKCEYSKVQRWGFRKKFDLE